MKNMKNERNEKKSPKKNAGFYIALAICVVAIAAAAWTTYGSVLEYSDLQQESSEQESSENIEVGKDVKGEKYESSAADESSEEPSENSVENSESSDTETSEPSVDTTKTPPVENGKIIKNFSPQNPVYSKTTSDWRTHNGIDIAASEGTPVRAITSGTVKSISKDAMLGNVICITHIGGYTAYYCGISDTPVVSEGNIVSTGDTIGYVSTVPSEMLDESHIHLAVMLENEYIDPETLY
ncbi:MAG: M23 family metallopeptidase [Clostridia bacterium]|nr:M23 family metallopeptidase [Clostridia bacterium]